MSGLTCKPCRLGHTDRDSSGNCRVCRYVANLKHKRRNPDYGKARYAAGFETERARCRKYAQTEQGRANQRRRSSAYKKRHPHKNAASQMRRKAAKLQRTPAWADMALIEVFYDEACRLTAETGIEHEVDHVIPLQGEFVSGLHVQNNLQVIPAVDNWRKHNKFEMVEDWGDYVS